MIENKPRAHVVARAAQLLADAGRSGCRTPDFEGPWRLESADEAFGVQKSVSVEMGGALAWKVSADPRLPAGLSYAPIFAGQLHASPAIFPEQDDALIVVEAELAFTLSQPLPPERGPFDRAAASRAIDAGRLVIELVCSRFSTPLGQLSPLHLLADCGGSAALILGGEVGLDALGAPEEMAVSLAHDGAQVCAQMGVAHDPVGLLVRLANHLNMDGDMLRAGDVVTTGAICYAVAQPGRYVARLGDAVAEVQIRGRGA